MDRKKPKKELSEKIRMEIIDQHFKGKGYKTISKQLDIPVSTVANIVKKVKVHGSVANLPGRGRKRKIDPRLNKRIARMVNKEPTKTSKEIQAELQGQGTSVSERTIRRFLSDSGLKVGPRKGPNRTPPLKEPAFRRTRLEAAKMHIDETQCPLET